MPAPVNSASAETRFDKGVRVRRRSEYLLAQSTARRVHTSHFVLLFRDRADAGPARLGVTTSRKVGTAVVRNRVRRLVREVFRLHRGAFPSGHDCIVVVRQPPEPTVFVTVRDELLPALTRRGRPARPSPSPRSAR